MCKCRSGKGIIIILVRYTNIMQAEIKTILGAAQLAMQERKPQECEEMHGQQRQS